MSDVVVYDKAKWHYEHEDYPSELPDEQGGVYCGFAIAWFSANGLLSEDMIDDWDDEL